MSFSFGIDHFLSDVQLQKKLQGKRVAFLGHPGSVTKKLEYSLDKLFALKSLHITALFGPQHGFSGEKQDNMIESCDGVDPWHNIPIFSLYGKVRRLTKEMSDTFDVLFVDLQDVGCRIYTFLTTLFYTLEDCAKYKKEIWIFDRPNPIGRPIEGFLLDENFKSFIGAAEIPMRHGFTLAEAAQWYKSKKKLNIDLHIVSMQNYDLEKSPGFGWPLGEMAWVNPSPNMPCLSTARTYPGFVLFEGTKFSEGRGTTRPLELFGAPSFNSRKILREIQRLAPKWLNGCQIRPLDFEPTFHKFSGKLCHGLQVHTDNKTYDHKNFRSFRLACVILKAIKNLYPDFNLWLDPPYEYETEKMPIDILNGNSFLREWIENQNATCEDLDKKLSLDEAIWKEEHQKFLMY